MPMARLIHGCALLRSVTAERTILVVQHIPRAHSQSPKEVDPNREYKIRRAALGDNPTQEEMDAVVAYGLEQHRKMFPQLYND